MKRLLGQIKASKTALYFHSASLGILFLSFSFLISNLRSGDFNLYVASDSMEFLHLIYITIFAVFSQFLALLLFTVIANKVKKSEEKSIYLESSINSLTITNICLSVLLILRTKYLFLPNTMMLTTIILFSFFCGFFISVALLDKANDNDSLSIAKGIINKLVKLIRNFSFPYYKRISIPLIVLGLCIIILERLFKYNSINIYLGALLMLVGTVYYFFGSHFSFKCKDELQRQIILEQSYFKSKFIVALLFITIIISISFDIKVEFIRMLWIFFPIILLSEAYIKDKYE